MLRIVTASLAGAATGGRSLTGLAALSLTTPSDDPRRLEKWLGHPWTKRILPALALGEIVVDKLPQTPSRLQGGPLVVRAAIGALCGAIVARRAPAKRTPPAHLEAKRLETLQYADLAAIAAVVVSALGVRWRAWAAPALGGDLLAAIVEDVVAVAVASSAAHRDLVGE
jgi:uncharacterized membrane protein